MTGLFSPEAHKRIIFNRGHPVPGRDPFAWRRDDLGNLVLYSDYRNRGSAYGWNIEGSFDDPANLRPVHVLAVPIPNLAA
jgi:hypothetical protein